MRDRRILIGADAEGGFFVVTEEAPPAPLGSRWVAPPPAGLGGFWGTLKEWGQKVVSWGRTARDWITRALDWARRLPADARLTAPCGCFRIAQIGSESIELERVSDEECAAGSPHTVVPASNLGDAWPGCDAYTAPTPIGEPPPAWGSALPSWALPAGVGLLLVLLLKR